MEILIKKVHFLVFLIHFLNFSFSRTISQEPESAKSYCHSHPKDLNCSDYRRVYKSTSQDGKSLKFELGTRLSWDVDHVPNPCDECRKPHGNCGVGLRCLCHVTECKVEVSAGSIKKMSGTMLFSLLFLIVLLDHLEGVSRLLHSSLV